MTKCLPLVLFAALLAAVPSPACAPAPMRGEYVEITNESALIIWDAESKTEHFIRRAAFQSTSTDFGFLVPTPTQPELAEADDSVFDHNLINLSRFAKGTSLIARVIVNLVNV